MTWIRDKTTSHEVSYWGGTRAGGWAVGVDMVHLSERQRIEILTIYGYENRKRTQSEVCTVFNEIYPDTPVSQGKVCQLIKKFRETGNVKEVKRTGRPKSATKQIHPYKPQLIHELNEDDFDRRMDFCEYTMERCNADENFASNIVFSDYCITQIIIHHLDYCILTTFMLNGILNRHNCRYWARANPHGMQEPHTQYPQEVNVWTGIIRGHTIGPFFLMKPLPLIDIFNCYKLRIPAEVLHRATTVEFKYRLGHCLAVNGAQFEHLI
ncbi:hypothetical protein NQ318_011472 [Aromia moschata]|uniref:DUF4817 domain-containing protein n=1 Tax=Aromia moschata TaxID=1265417 RepID=A0AAV8Y0B1_9CUCU|nr:hypothetical protein NQ318_011472 [Aromia moschata]